MPTPFVPHIPTNDLDVLDVSALEEGWDRVAVVGLWLDAKLLRRRFPKPAVVGPLRTYQGLAPLMANLLANPQIRAVVVVGRDLSPRRDLLPQLAAVLGAHCFQGWQGPENGILTVSSAMDPEAQDLWAALKGWAAPMLVIPHWHGALQEDISIPVFAEHAPIPDPVFVDLPVPKLDNNRLPPGDPGDRVVGHSVPDVWMRTLQRALTCGYEAETQYGMTLEMHNLVSVIRGPHLAPHSHEPPNGLTWEAILRYAKQFDPSALREGSLEGQDASYTYGSRLQSTGEPQINQIQEVLDLLARAPNTRAAYMTPWSGEQDAGTESGRPCLVGVHLRVRGVHLLPTFTFRSHDLYGASLLNLYGLIEAAAGWIAYLGERGLKGLHLGDVTVISNSAHLYERDYDRARATLCQEAETGWPNLYPNGDRIDWDRRSLLQIEVQKEGQEYVDVDPNGEAEGLVYLARVIDPVPPHATLREVRAPSPTLLLRELHWLGTFQSYGNASWVGQAVENAREAFVRGQKLPRSRKACEKPKGA